MEIYDLAADGFGSNCYILISGKSAAVVDPSASTRDIVRFAEQKGAIIEMILLTHGHFDHVTSLDELRDATHAQAYIHKDDNEMLSDGDKNAHAVFFGYTKKWRDAEVLLQDGDTITLGEERIKVISTPGHSKGSICLFCGDKLITGDTLFANGYGRYDLHGGDARALSASLSSLRSLDPNLIVYPGHGSTSTLGHALDNILYY